MNPLPTPTASYRLQLTPDFGFDAVVAHLDTIRTVGVSHVYLSPIAQAVPESRHGYDVADHTSIRAEFGGRSALDRLLDACLERHMGVIVDHVPNHVSVERAELNRPWWAMLRNGPTSDAARWFDVDWEAGDGRVIIPRLGEPLDDVLATGGITRGESDLGPELRYGPLRFPMAPGTEDLDVPEAIRHQHYRLSWWRDPARNVRRFFTIDDLVAVRVEDPDVARAVDTIPRVLTAHPAFAGVRVDHVDGLADPGDYLGSLRELLGDRLLFVEKILGPAERLPPEWPVDGTTGYEHITSIEHTLLDPRCEETLVGLWTTSTGTDGFEELEEQARREVLESGLAPDLDRVVRTLLADGADTDPDATRESVIELTVALDRYRTYLPGDAASQEVLAESAERADHRNGDAGEIARVLSRSGESLTRWQQLTGPVMAKGAEDRAFYRYFPLASLCEVGGAPGVFSTPIDRFHRMQIQRQHESPLGMLASTTHDTKRSSGVRARSLALAARAKRWVSLVEDWTAHHEDLTTPVNDPGLVLLAVQTAVTARPLTQERLTDYLVKAAREADRVTHWAAPDPSVEAALADLAAALVADTSPDAGPLDAFASMVEAHGVRIDLALLAVQLTCPGFADLYQGSPRGLFSLVDPDNRVPPDWSELDELVTNVSTSDTASALARGDVDLARTIMTERILSARVRRSGAFGVDAGFDPIEVTGDGADHVAYARSDADGPVMVVIVSRALVEPVGEQVEVDIPSGAWRSLLHDDAQVIDGGRTRLVSLYGDIGLAVLERTDS